MYLVNLSEGDLAQELLRGRRDVLTLLRRHVAERVLRNDK